VLSKSIRSNEGGSVNSLPLHTPVLDHSMDVITKIPLLNQDRSFY
jgi:hypothetical protein